MRNLAERFVGAAKAKAAFGGYFVARGIKATDSLRADDAAVEVAERLLSGAMGAMAARRMLASALRGGKLELDDLASIVGSASRTSGFNRALLGQYPPGSTFKVLVALAGMETGVVTPETRVYCNGSTTVYGARRLCWKRGRHGWVDVRKALTHSCNVYFYKLGQNLGIDEIHRFGDALSLGRPTGIDLTGDEPDLQSGEVIEFNNDEIERLQVIVARELGYRLVDHRLELYGVPLADSKKAPSTK